MSNSSEETLPSGIKYILWDWNGTLLNDVWLCLDTINSMLGKRAITELTIDRYKEIFNFPVRKYYQQAGFSFEKEPFELLAVEFIDGYYSGFNRTELHAYAKEILKNIHEAGLSQGILSATEHQTLLKNLKTHNLEGIFDHLSGINNHHADGKLHAGRKILGEIELATKDILMVGDTLHDAEVAEALDLSFCFVSHGHQSRARLERTGYPVFANLEHFWNALKLKILE